MRITIKTLLIACLFVVCQSSFAQTPKVYALSSYIEGLVQAQFDDYKLAGLTMVVVKDSEVVFKQGFGVADIETGEPVDPDRHLFRPGSVSKLFTWTAVMQLVEQGRLDLNAPVTQYVDQFEIPNNFDQPITMAHIMTHAPGLEDGALGYLFRDKPEDLIPLAEALAQHTPAQVRAPGTHSSYSNWATALAGLVVANISGMSFEEYVQAHIFNPLGMAQATFVEPLPVGLADDMTTGYVQDMGGLKAFPFELISNFGPAGAMSAASGEMAKFMLAHLNGGAYNNVRILQPETTARMHSALFSHDDQVAAMAHGFYEIWRNGQRFVGHGGNTITFHSQLVLDPVNNFGLFLSFNSSEGARASGAVVNGIIDFFYPRTPPRYVFEPLEGSAERIAAIVGSYRMNRRSYTRLEGLVGIAGDLNVAPAGDGRIFIPGDIGGQFAEVEPYVFQLVGGDERLVFAHDSGVVTHAFVSSLPIMVGEKLSASQSAGNHQLVLMLTLLASLFVLINGIRNRGDGLVGAAAMGRRMLYLASVLILLFFVGFATMASGLDINRILFDFPLPGTGIVLLFPVLGLLATAIAVLYLLPVWRAEACNLWARLRYTYVCLVYLLFFAVLHYWNVLGWNY